MIQVTVTGEESVHRLLAGFMEPQLTKRAQHATKVGANVLKAPMKAAVAPLSKRMADSVYVHVAKREKPAYVVGHHRKVAYFWSWMLGGTKDHGPRKQKALYFIPNWNQYMPGGPPAGASQIRAIRVRGLRARPVLEGLGERYRQQIVNAMVADMLKQSQVSSEGD